MLNTCTFLIDDLRSLNSDGSTLKECVFACIIKDGSYFEKNKINAFYDLNTSENASLFSFYFDLRTHNDCSVFVEWIMKNDQILLRYFFHPNYKINGNAPLLFANAAMKENKNLINGIAYLNEKAIEQGYDGICCKWLSENTSENKQDVNQILTIDKSGKTITMLYHKQLLEDHYVSRYIGLHSVDFEKDLNDLKSAEDMLKHQHPSIYHLLKTNHGLKYQTLALAEEIKNITLQLQNQKIYLQLIREQDEANKINEFYHNEYEILPLWYKKLGQVIKVLTGKRAFRSLFDSNVKKYKE
jgi:hypothetical protein